MASSRRLFVSVLAAPIVAFLIALPLFVRLVTTPDQHPLRQWLVEEPSALTPRPIPLTFIGPRDGGDVFVIPLTTPHLSALLEFHEIAFVIGNEFTAALLMDGSLHIEGTACRYTTTRPIVLETNELLWFVRGPGCEAEPGSGTRELKLEIRIVRTSGRVAIWTFEDPTTEQRLLYAPPYQGKQLAVRGQGGRMPRPSALSRAELLAALWNSTAGAIWLQFGVALFTLLAGLTLLHLSDGGIQRGRLWFAAIGTGCCIAGLALATAVVVPPLQAPDEPDHLMTFGELMARPDMAHDVPAMARRTHFERIRHNYTQHFRSEDLDRPWPVAWESTAVYVENMTERSPLTVWWWRLQHLLTRQHRDAPLLLHLRQNNAILVGFVSAIAVLVLGASLPAMRPALVGLWMLVIPVLPFYAMSMTDTPVILSSTLLLAVSLVVVVLDTNRGALVGAALGVAITAVLVSGRRVWPLLIVAVVVLLARALCGAPGQNRRQTLLFWASLTLSVGFGLWWATSLGIFTSAIDLITLRRPELSSLARAAIGRAWMFAGVIPILAAVDLAGARFRKTTPHVTPSRIGRWIGTGGAIAILLPLVASRFIPFPTTNNISVLTSSASDYVVTVLQSMAVPFRLAHFDLLLSTLFWGGFGWSDTVPREWLIATLCAATAVMIAWTWWQAGWSGPRRLILLTALIIGLWLALAGSALGAYALQYDLYGRYLLGWYVVLLATTWTPPARLAQPAWLVWAAPALLVHAYCLQFIVLRYF